MPPDPIELPDGLRRTQYGEHMLPMLGNLAWAPMPAIENVDVLDRFNGVPTLGLFTAAGERNLFWRVTGYVPRSFSVWLYVPLTDGDEARLAPTDPADLLDDVVFGGAAHRYATVGIARDYRLVFEREWQVPAGADALGLLRDVLGFLRESLAIALDEDMPPARRELVWKTSEAIRELADA